METSQQYEEYIRHMEEIRSLSTPSLDGISNAESYSTRLRDNFIKIGSSNCIIAKNEQDMEFVKKRSS